MCTGDVIVGDRDGLVVIAPRDLQSTLSLATDREHEEREFRRRIAAGASTVELLDLTATLQQYALI